MKKIDSLKNKWNCSTVVYSYSRELNKEVFDLWNKEVGYTLDSPISFHFVDKNTFKLHFYLEKEVVLEDVKIRAFMLSSIILVSVNLATPGDHIWWPPALWPIKFNVEEITKKIALIFPPPSFSDRAIGERKVLDRNTLDRAFYIFCAIGSLDEYYFKHYIKAMDLLSSPSAEINFYEEIFLNFWKCIERFIAKEIKGNKKQPSKDEIIENIKKSSEKIWNDEMKDEVSKLYNLRGNTVAHSCGKDSEVTFEEAGKCKVFADNLLRFHLEKKAKEKLK